MNSQIIIVNFPYVALFYASLNNYGTYSSFNFFIEFVESYFFNNYGSFFLITLISSFETVGNHSKSNQFVTMAPPENIIGFEIVKGSELSLP